MAEWYYMSGGAQTGPVSGAELKQLAATGVVGRGDFVWRDGMADWIEAGKVNGLFTAAGARPVTAGAGARGDVAQGAVTTQAAASQAPYSAPVRYAQPAHDAPEPEDAAADTAALAPAAAIGYYSPTAGIPSRAAHTLARLPSTTGQTHEWPLSEPQLRALAQTARPRRLLTGLATWFRICGMIDIVILGVIVFMLMALSSRGMVMNNSYLMGVLAAMGVVAALYLICGAGIRNCQKWALWVMIGMHVVMLGLQITSAVMSNDPIASDTPQLMSFILALLVPTVNIVLSCQALAAIPKFLASPVWCQEALIQAKY